MSDAVSANFVPASKPMYATTRLGGYAGMALASLTVVASGYMLMTGSTIVTQGALVAGLLFNTLFLFYSYSYFMRGRRTEDRTSGSLMLLVMACACGVGVAIISAKIPGMVVPMTIYALAYLIASSTFIWDLSDDR